MIQFRNRDIKKKYNTIIIRHIIIYVLFFKRVEKRTECKIFCESFEQENEVVYLGSMVSRNRRREMDVERRIATERCLRYYYTAV